MASIVEFEVSCNTQDYLPSSNLSARFHTVLVSLLLSVLGFGHSFALLHLYVDAQVSYLDLDSFLSAMQCCSKQSVASLMGV